MTLDTTPRLDDPDALFAALAEAHRDLSPAASRHLDAALVLLLANQIGDTQTVIAAIGAARAAILAQPDAPSSPQDTGDFA